MKDPRAHEAASYEHYFGSRKLALAPWWRAVNAALEDQGRATLLFRQASAWWAEGLSPAEAVTRELENLESAQEERSAYDV
jgi:alkylated DNA nucleotide flippase Atl1